MVKLTVTQKVHLYLYGCTRKFRKPKAVNVTKLAEVWGCTPAQVSEGLRRLIDKGNIRRTDKDGNPIPRDHDTPAHKRLLKLVLDNKGKLPWDRRSQINTARKLEIKFSSLRVIKRRINHLLHTEYDEHNHPTEIIILDEAEALAFLGDEPVVHSSAYGNFYYKYVKGWSKRNLQPKPKAQKPVKPPVKYIKHRLLEYLVEAGGKVLGGCTTHAKNLGCTPTAFTMAALRLERQGIITRSSGHIEIRDPEAVSFILAPFTDAPPNTPHTTRSLPSGLPSRRGKNSCKSSNCVTVLQEPPYPQNGKTVAKALISLVIRKRLEWEVARMLLYYPRNYEKGQQKIMETYRKIDVHTEEEDEVRRQKAGIQWARQKDICRTLLTSIRTHLGLGGALLEALVEETARRLQGFLPTVDNPDNDAAQQLVDFCELALPVDGTHLDWLNSFIDHSKTQLLSEFVCRGGIDMLVRIKAWNDADSGVIEQRVAWDIFAYLAYISRRPFDARWPEQFPNINGWDGVKTEESFWQGLTVADALSDYLAADYKLGSIEQLKPLLTRALCDKYPVRGPDGVTLTSAWDQESVHENLAVTEEYNTLRQWVAEMEQEMALLEGPRVEKFSLAWYEAKLERVRDYGLPGDVEIINQKVSALRRWCKADIHEQREKLVPMLNKPCRYCDPRLPWEEWDRIARQ